MTELIARYLPLQRFRQRNRRKQALVMSVLAVVLLLLLIGSGFFIGADRLTVNFDIANSAPCLKYPFGTD